jgi:hypothetical protein
MTADPPPALLYRVEERRFAGGVDAYGDPIPGDRGPLEVRIFAVRVEKRTPRGWRLSGGRFVLEGARKQWACPTPEEAITSFIARKRRQALIHRSRMTDAIEALNGATRMRGELLASVPDLPQAYWGAAVRTSALLDMPRVEVKPPLAQSNPEPPKP